MLDHPERALVAQFEFRFIGKGPKMSLKNRTYGATEIIAIHHGLSTIGNRKIRTQSHQGVGDHRLPSESAGFALSSIQGRLRPNYR
jgi:hypothetical protein